MRILPGFPGKCKRSLNLKIFEGDRDTNLHIDIYTKMESIYNIEFYIYLFLSSNKL